MAKNTIQETIQRTQRYWYVDGLAEMGTGVVMLFYGFLVLITNRLPDGWASIFLNGFGQPLFLVGGIFLVSLGVRRLKERLTYPRTGYVVYRRRPQRALRGLLLGAFFGMLVSGASVLLTQALRDNWIPAMVGLLLGAVEAWLGYAIGIKRFYVLALFTLLLGLGLAIIKLPGDYQFPLFFVGLGLSWIVSGAFTLAGYLRQTRPAGEAG